jgi:alpha-glucuronidase
MANCMIQSKGLSLKYWEKAIKCSNYIINRTPTNALKNITSEEDWTKIKPDVSYFCVFGSIAWAHIPDEKRKALQPKSEKCIFFCYSKDSKVIDFFNHIVMTLLLEEMLHLMKIYWSASLI